MTIPQTIIVTTRQWGALECEVDRDGLGNPRLFPVNGVDLSQWREDKNLVPPWLIPTDLVNPYDWPKDIPVFRRVDFNGR
jgi:hypothetical protein